MSTTIRGGRAAMGLRKVRDDDGRERYEKVTERDLVMESYAQHDRRNSERLTDLAHHGPNVTTYHTDGTVTRPCRCEALRGALRELREAVMRSTFNREGKLSLNERDALERARAALSDSEPARCETCAKRGIILDSCPDPFHDSEGEGCTCSRQTAHPSGHLVGCPARTDERFKPTDAEAVAISDSEGEGS